MKGIGWDDAHVALHILAATVWVGGQITLPPVLLAVFGALSALAAVLAVLLGVVLAG